MILQEVAPDDLAGYFCGTILSTKRQLGFEYLQRATIWSDLRILVDTALGRWDSYSLQAQWSNAGEGHMKASNGAATLSQ